MESDWLPQSRKMTADSDYCKKHKFWASHLLVPSLFVFRPLSPSLMVRVGVFCFCKWVQLLLSLVLMARTRANENILGLAISPVICLNCQKHQTSTFNIMNCPLRFILVAMPIEWHRFLHANGNLFNNKPRKRDSKYLCTVKMIKTIWLMLLERMLCSLWVECLMNSCPSDALVGPDPKMVQFGRDGVNWNDNL